MTHKEPVYIIIPVHNRKAVTVRCLAHLQQQEDFDRYFIIVVDDGSSDGTAEALQANYPTVVILTGNGKLWWTGAIRKGMEYAVNQGANYLIWLNDDCLPQPGAIARLLNICQTDSQMVVGGQAFDPDTHQSSYGGVINHTFSSVMVNATSNQLLECDGLNGNLVCMPSSVVQAIGYPDNQRFPHYHGDTTYTHLAKRNGYKLALCGDAVSFCRNDHTPIAWFATERSISQLWEERFTIKSPHYWKAHLGFYNEMLGFIGVGVYAYEMLIRFIIISVIAAVLPYRRRVQLKNWLRGDFGSA